MRTQILHRILPLGLVLLLLASARGQESPRLAPGSTLDAPRLITKYCFGCHDTSSKAGDFDFETFLSQDRFDATLPFENLITERMPPSDADQPSRDERQAILAWLANRSTERDVGSYRRISRHEFVHSLNDLLGVRLDVADEIPEDRGTNRFDSDRRIMLSREQLTAYFKAADEMLDVALPRNGFPAEQRWTTSTIKDSHETYNI